MATYDRIKDIVGQRFGRLTVVKFAELRGQARWLCDCDCGNQTTVTGGSLRSGNTMSCGCLHRESVSKRNIASSTHGMFGTPEYRSWSAMMTRCTNPSHAAYQRYGGRGISVCDDWKTFERFYGDMGPRPPGCSIERIDNNMGYEPANCRWATRVEQQRNKRSNRIISHDGRSLPVSEWAEIVGLTQYTIHARLGRGWTTEDALTKPLRRETTRPRR
jgi:hypothetical protein